MKNIITIIIFLSSSIIYSQKTIEEHGETFPIYKGCENQTNKIVCFKQKVQELIAKNYNTDTFSEYNIKPGINRIFMVFIINKEGNVDSIKVKAPHIKLEQEAVRVIKLIPHCVPGTKNNTPVNVKFSLPISVNVEKKKKTKNRKNPWQ